MNSRKMFLVTAIYFFWILLSKAKMYVCKLFWLECKRQTSVFSHIIFPQIMGERQGIAQKRVRAFAFVHLSLLAGPL